VSDERHALAALALGKRPSIYSIGGNVGPDGRSGRVRKISPPLGFDSRPVHPLSNRYTDYARILSVLLILCPVKKDLHGRYLHTLTKNSRSSDRSGPRTLVFGGGLRIRDTYVHMHVYIVIGMHVEGSLQI
jgi:hypothetical protein